MRAHFILQLEGWNRNPKPFGKLYFMLVKEDGTKEIRSVYASGVDILSEDYEFIKMSSDAVPEFKYKETTCY